LPGTAAEPHYTYQRNRTKRHQTPPTHPTPPDPQVGYEGDAPRGAERHPPPSDHRYETAADGHTREVHGEMLGPDEEEVLYSEDSDKVGYA